MLAQVRDWPKKSGLHQLSLKSVMYLFICLLSSFLSIAEALRPQSELFARELPDWQPLIETWKAKGGKHASALPKAGSVGPGYCTTVYHCIPLYHTVPLYHQISLGEENYGKSEV